MIFMNIPHFSLKKLIFLQIYHLEAWIHSIKLLSFLIHIHSNESSPGSCCYQQKRSLLNVNDGFAKNHTFGEE